MASVAINSAINSEWIEALDPATQRMYFISLTTHQKAIMSKCARTLPERFYSATDQWVGVGRSRARKGGRLAALAYARPCHPFFSRTSLPTTPADYMKNKLPDANERQQIADDIGITARSVQVWFQNRRQRQKLIQSAADIALLIKRLQSADQADAEELAEQRQAAAEAALIAAAKDHAAAVAEEAERTKAAEARAEEAEAALMQLQLKNVQLQQMAEEHKSQ